MLDIYTASSARKEEGEWAGAYAFAIYKDGHALYQLSTIVQQANQNESDLIGTMHAIHYAKQLYPNEPIQIITGSQYVFGGCTKVTKIKTNKDMWDTFNQLYNDKDMSITFVPKKDKSEKGKHVSLLAKMKLKTHFAPSLSTV